MARRRKSLGGSLRTIVRAVPVLGPMTLQVVSPRKGRRSKRRRRRKG